MPILYDIELDEVSLVDAGDNPEANVVFYKGRRLEHGSDEWIAVQTKLALANDGETPLSEETSTHTTATERREHLGDGRTITSREVSTMTTRQEVVEAVEQEAAQVRQEEPDLSLSLAKMRAWERRPDLQKQYQELPVETAPVVSPPVLKGSDAYGKIDAAAAELRKREPNLSPSAARTRVFEERPELAAEYNAAWGAA